MRWQVDIREKKGPEAFQDGAGREGTDSGGVQEAEGQGVALGGGRDGDAGLHEEEESQGLDAQDSAKVAAVEISDCEEGDDNADYAGVGPRDAEGHAFAVDEPLVEEEDGGE